MTPDLITRTFTQSDGGFLCARWGRAIAPVVFGMEEPSIGLFKSAAQLITGLAGHEVAETDPELGSNLMIFALRGWGELREVPDLDRLVPELPPLAGRLAAEAAQSYRGFRFDARGAIRAGFVFLDMTSPLAEVPGDLLALGEMLRIMLSWGPQAFDLTPMLAEENGQAVLNADLLRLLRAAYDPMLPEVADDASHALRLAARLETPA